jgi:PAS domain S-box-containing protein
VVEDDEVAGRALEKLLRADGFTAVVVGGGEAALVEARRALPAVVLTDLRMQPMGGLELCKRLHELDHDLPVIVMTGHSDMDSVVEALRERAEDYLMKPFRYEALLWCVERALARRAAKAEHEDMQRSLNERLLRSSTREREHAEAESRQRAQQSALFENLSEGVIIAEAGGSPRMINVAARAILGIGDLEIGNVDELHGYEVQDLDGSLLEIAQRPVARVLRGDLFADYEVLYVKPDGERRHLSFTGTSVRDAAGKLALGIVVFRDMTELRQLERQRDDYLALTCHDLRNPLSVVTMSLGVLKECLAENQEPLPAALATALRVVERGERNAKRMGMMLDELKEVTSLEVQGVTSLCVPCDLRQLVSNVLDSIDDGSEGRITIETDGASPYLVLGEASQLERVIANLVTNALKYSAERVTLRLARNENVIELHVDDRGIGIAPDSVTSLFERYYRTPAGRARASGLGLGLYIARLIVELHDGRISVCSEVGKGSSFKLVLPSVVPLDEETPDGSHR